MHWTDKVAAKVDEAAPGHLSSEIRALVADYASETSAGDWCVLWNPYLAECQIGVVNRVVQGSNGTITGVVDHECGHEIFEDERLHYSTNVQEELKRMDAHRGPMATKHAPRYSGYPRGDDSCRAVRANAYTDTGVVPFGWLQPVLMTAHYDNERLVLQGSLRIVAAGSRIRMEATYRRLRAEEEEEDEPEEMVLPLMMQIYEEALSTRPIGRIPSILRDDFARSLRRRLA